MYNDFLGRLIQGTTSFAEGYYGRREKYLQKPSFHALSELLLRIVLSLKSAEKRRLWQHVIGPFRVYSEELPAYDELVSKKIQEKIALKRLRAL